MKFWGVQKNTIEENSHENERIGVILGCEISFIARAKHGCTGGWLILSYAVGEPNRRKSTCCLYILRHELPMKKISILTLRKPVPQVQLAQGNHTKEIKMIHISVPLRGIFQASNTVLRKHHIDDD